MIGSSGGSKSAFVARISAVGIVVLAVALALASSPGSALAKRHKKNSGSSGTVNSLADPAAAAPDAACGTTFSVCCTITASGVYTMGANISTNITSGSCIAISDSGVTLNMAGYTINDTAASPGTAVGIVVTGRSNDFVEGANGNVSGFNNGIVMNSGTNSYVDNVNVSSNTGVGILAEGSGATISSISAASNKYGVEFLTCGTGNASLPCSLNFGVVNLNTGYGIWVNNSFQTVVSGIFADSNTVAGVYVGCNTTPGVGSCSWSHGDHTKIFNAISNTNKYGFYMESGETSNAITFNIGATNTTDDAFDNNINCAGTTWFEDQFTVVNRSCVK